MSTSSFTNTDSSFHETRSAHSGLLEWHADIRYTSQLIAGGMK